MSALAQKVPKRILLVDDDAGYVRTIGGYFEMLGYSVSTGESALEGLNEFHRQRPDVVIVDVHMPELSGLALVGLLKQKGARVLVLSGDDSLRNRLAAFEQGADAFLAKPIEIVDLRDAVEAA